MNLDVNRLSRRAFAVLVSCQVLLVVLDGMISYGRLIGNRAIGRLFNITREDSIPNWFASMQFFLIALVLWIIFLRVRELDGAKWRARGWAFLAGIFLFLSVDDGSKLHERIGTWFRASTEASDSFAAVLMDAHPSYSWHVAMGPIFALLGVYVLLFTWRALQSPFLRKLFLAGLACLALGQAMDVLEGIDEVVEYLSRFFSVSDYTVRHFSKSAEEFLEMFGQTLLLVTFLRHLAAIAEGWRLEFRTLA
jgi:hypothetical protein